MQSLSPRVVAGLVVAVLVGVGGACSGSSAPEIVEPSILTTTSTSAAATTTTSTDTAPVESTTTTTPPITTTTVPPALLPTVDSLVGVDFEVTTVATFEFPTGAAVGPDGALYVIGQLGPVWRVEPGSEPTVVLDLTDRTSVQQGGSSERGLLGIAFHPDDERMYVHFTDTDGDNVVASWALGDRPEATSLIAVADSERFVIGQDQPGPGHNGGGIVFGRDGVLFIGIGDGGASGGDDARDLSNYLGTVLRIVPRLDDSGYDVPGDNPFVAEPDIADEIWAYGFRNPWRIFLDEPTGDLWVGDVGNATTEELNVVAVDARVRDFGWNLYEGTRQISDLDGGEVAMPVHEWGRDIGYSSIGGVVLRGDQHGAADGAVVFGDLGGAVMLLGSDGVEVRRPKLPGLVSLNLGADGDLYAVVIWGELVKLDLTFVVPNR
ncbi:MAG: PQQ-dependent sugar dehydrogenase [Actinomycetia bacterium]|nr:PQQ-dependent sugar dehydrogenase [Actinomycetes bacterium]MCP4963091.1 PQQ-dependent sugar dehydrogenase [Actinomycetes bacterium]